MKPELAPEKQLPVRQADKRWDRSENGIGHTAMCERGRAAEMRARQTEIETQGDPLFSLRLDDPLMQCPTLLQVHRLTG